MYFLTLLALAPLALGVPANRKHHKPHKHVRAGGLQFVGVNEAGPEFGEGNLPGTYGTDYTWPTLSTIDTFISKGMNTFRINTLMERMAPDTMAGQLDDAYMGNLTETVNYITKAGAYAMICPHNYGRYYGNVIQSASDFGTFWTNVAKLYKGNNKVMFDTNNEYHDMAGSLVAQLNQAAINGIRKAGATSQYITVEGNAYTGAWTWTTTTGTDGKTNADTMGTLTDPQNKLIYQVRIPPSTIHPFLTQPFPLSPNSFAIPPTQPRLTHTDAPIPRLRRLRHKQHLRLQHNRQRTPRSRNKMASLQQ